MSVYNIYVEGQQRDAYVARKAVEKERAKVAEEKRRDESFKNAMAHKNYSHQLGDDDSNKFIDRISNERKETIRKNNKDIRDLLSHNRQMKDYINANAKTSNIFTKKGRESRENIAKYKDTIKDNNEKIKEIEKSTPQHVSTLDPDVRHAVMKHNKRHPDHKLESGIFAECVLI